jgi:uncharacterized membrane protein
MSTSTFLILRVLHVLLAAVWLGMTCFVALFLFPAVGETGPAAGPVMGALMRRKVPAVQASLGGIVVLTGLYLYWRFTGGFDPALSATRAAMVFGTGGILGIAALIVGGSVVSRNGKKMASIGARLASMADGAERSAAVAEMTAARHRALIASRIVLVLQAIALATMAVGHYV